MFKNLFSFKGSPKITEKIIEQYGINIISFKDIKLDKDPIALTGSGTFYKGTYKKIPYTAAVFLMMYNFARLRGRSLWRTRFTATTAKFYIADYSCSAVGTVSRHFYLPILDIYSHKYL